MNELLSLRVEVSHEDSCLLFIMRRMIANEETAVRIGRALDARKEMKLLADEFRALARKTSFATRAIDRLNIYLDPNIELMADGSAEIPVKLFGWT